MGTTVIRSENTQASWRSIQSAPKDGTIIEIQLNLGFESLEPWSGAFFWDEDEARYINARDTYRGIDPELIASGDLFWRPYIPCF